MLDILNLLLPEALGGCPVRNASVPLTSGLPMGLANGRHQEELGGWEEKGGPSLLLGVGYMP